MAFAYYRSITIDHTKVPGTLSNFPVLVSISDATFKTVGNGGHVRHSASYDVCFFADSAASTALDWGVETYDETTGVYVAWVKIPSVSSSSDTTFYVFYGDSGISTPQSTPSAVWDSNYKLVMHLQTLSGSLVDLDATSNGLHGTAVNSPTATAGQIDGAGSFDDASTQYIECASGFPTTRTDFTMSAWFRMSSKPSLTTLFQSSQGFNGVAFYANNFNSISVLYPLVVDNRFTDFNLSADKTYYIAFTRNGTTLKVYVYNFTDSTSGTQSLTEGGTEPARDGKYYVGYSVTGGPFDGWIDELRWSQTDRGANWIQAEYNNQSSPSTFYALGSETANAISGTLAVSLGVLTVSATGTVAIAGSTAATLAAVTASATGTVAVAGALDSTLEALSASVAGTVAVTGVDASTLAGVTVSAVGAVAVTGSPSVTLGAVTLSASGTVVSEATGTLAVTLDALTATAAATAEIAGSTSATLGAITAAATGTVDVSASLGSTLGSVTLSAAGSVVGPVEGSLSATLAACSVSAAGTLLVSASLSVTLGNTTCVATVGTPITSIRVRQSYATPVISTYAATPVIMNYTATPDTEY